ncbi:MAG: hypothetical protein EOO62_04755 [Hymenobacter sp.]|nr:MAG: hypothetical protein EOO62_04755 [Hymenobacter sp.]
MTATLPVAPEMVTSKPVQPLAAGPTLAEIKARAKAIKKHRKHEGRRFFHGLCQCLHAIGFSF